MDTRAMIGGGGVYFCEKCIFSLMEKGRGGSRDCLKGVLCYTSVLRSCKQSGCVCSMLHDVSNLAYLFFLQTAFSDLKRYGYGLNHTGL